MDSRVMELRLKQWIPIFEEQAKSGLNKKEWCRQNDVKRDAFFKCQKELRKYLIEKGDNNIRDEHSTEFLAPTEPDFVELEPSIPTVRSSMNACCVRSSGNSRASSISIRYGKFSIDLKDDVNERLLSKIIKVMADVN